MWFYWEIQKKYLILQQNKLSITMTVFTLEEQQLEIIKIVLQIKDQKYLRRLQTSLRGKQKSILEKELREMEKREKELEQSKNEDENNKND